MEVERVVEPQRLAVGVVLEDVVEQRRVSPVDVAGTPRLAVEMEERGSLEVVDLHSLSAGPTWLNQ